MYIKVIPRAEDQPGIAPSLVRPIPLEWILDELQAVEIRASSHITGFGLSVVEFYSWYTPVRSQHQHSE